MGINESVSENSFLNFIKTNVPFDYMEENLSEGTLYRLLMGKDLDFGLLVVQ